MVVVLLVLAFVVVQGEQGRFRSAKPGGRRDLVS